jgi:hypothetical protein
MPCFIFTKMRKITKFRVRNFVFARSNVFTFSRRYKTLPVFARIFTKNSKYFRAALCICSRLTQIFRENFRKNQNIWPNFMNLISSNIFTKIVDLFHMLLSSFAFFYLLAENNFVMFCVGNFANL